jgi:uncharacterized membrane protein YoaK (UPF0700 family)
MAVPPATRIISRGEPRASIIMKAMDPGKASSSAGPVDGQERRVAAVAHLESTAAQPLHAADQFPFNSPGSRLDRHAKSLPVGLSLAAAGGFLDAFTFVGHGRVFANAMTGNVILLGVDAISGSWSQSLHHLLPILSFLGGVATARIMRLPRMCTFVRQPQLAVLGLELSLLFALGFLPPTASDFLFTMTIAFAASLQMTTFHEIEGRAYSSTFTTGNLRTMVETFCEWAFDGRKPLHLRESRMFALICSIFFIGATAGAFATHKLFNRALWIDVGVLALVEVSLLRSARRPHPDA